MRGRRGASHQRLVDRAEERVQAADARAHAPSRAPRADPRRDRRAVPSQDSAPRRGRRRSLRERTTRRRSEAPPVRAASSVATSDASRPVVCSVPDPPASCLDLDVDPEWAAGLQRLRRAAAATPGSSADMSWRDRAEPGHLGVLDGRPRRRPRCGRTSSSTPVGAQIPRRDEGCDGVLPARPHDPRWAKISVTGVLLSAPWARGTATCRRNGSLLRSRARDHMLARTGLAARNI